jgi:hypothetical protein
MLADPPKMPLLEQTTPEKLREAAKLTSIQRIMSLNPQLTEIGAGEGELKCLAGQCRHSPSSDELFNGRRNHKPAIGTKKKCQGTQ